MNIITDKDQDKLQTSIDALAAFVVLIICAIPCTLFGGVVVQHLWNWFMNPILGLPILGFWQGLGVATVVVYLTHSIASGMGLKLDTPKKAFEYVFTDVTRDALFLFMGYVLHLMIK